MAVYPGAVWRPLPENAYQVSIVPRTVILHSAVDAPGPSSLFNFFRYSSGLESHFFVKNDGVVEQYMDTSVRADANLYANPFAISIETEDEGDPNDRKWTPAQIKAIKGILNWVWRVHPTVPRRLCPAWDEGGIGYHTMFGAPSQWTPVVKTCPGTIRKVQFHAELKPWIEAGFPTVPPNEVYVDVRVRQLRQGDKGNDVRSLQLLLNGRAGQRLVVDGDFGPATAVSVNNLKRFFGLPDDGVMGPKAWEVLFLP